MLDVGAGAAAAECIVVRVVVRDRTDGAGDEKVLSAPRPVLPPTVAFVAPPEDVVWEGAASEWATSVDIVAAVDLFPIVGGGSPSSEDRIESPLLLKDDKLAVSRVGVVEVDCCCLFVGVVSLIIPDSGYGLFLTA